MLARNLVIKNGQLPVTFRASDTFGGYHIDNQSLYLLYDVILPTRKNFYNWEEDRYHLAQVRADDFLVSENFNDGETPFLKWAVRRAHDLVDHQVLGQSWKLRLTDSGIKRYFNVEFAGPSKPHIKMYHQDNSNFLWTNFISDNTELYDTIKAQFEAEDMV